ncbi:hypothetical protein QAD02_017261 [Eretmocerus hayati]|uniref:Uncharacterized protein n=1 Tax=Eretmocerus hayati TaxID=131215 RepID=A0ACC2PCX6_9HYME|nr:hypothetical protein QAD02_017261 [Eretmocerus hayati]
MVRHNNQLPDNLPQLQNLIKRDPESYKEEFLQQHRHYQSTLDVFNFTPDKFNKSLDELVMFLAQVAHCYPDNLRTFPQEIIDLLRGKSTILDSEMRMTFCRALILLRNKGLLEPTALLSLFFELLRCQDKALRQFLQQHIISDVRGVNAARSSSCKLNTALQNFMFKMLGDANARAAKMSLDIMCELYRRRVWNEPKTVNVIAQGCFSKIAKDERNQPSLKDTIMANKVNKKTKKRQKQLKRAKQLFAKSKKKKERAPAFNFSALHLIHDPQGMAERLFKHMERSNERFEVKLMSLDVVSRLIGLHSLLLLNFYPYVQRFLQPHQREVTKLLQFSAQAAHELVPPDVMQPLLKTLVNNFVTERNSADVMAIGLNAVREICARCPLAMDEDLLRDLVQYKTYRERSVMMAARSLIGLFRQAQPELLHRKDRGRPTEAAREIALDSSSRRYGELAPREFVRKLQKKSKRSKLERKKRKLQEKLKMQERMNARKKVEYTAEKKANASKVSAERLLTDDDFKRIDMAMVKQQVTYAKRPSKRSAQEANAPGELVRLADIENIHKKRKHDKQSRLESVQKGQEDREKFGYKDGRQNPLCSKTNRERNKKKNFQMIKHKVKGKVKRSFKEKQIALRNHLVKLKRMK